MNLVFGSEVALLGFWEYMFRILFRVHCTRLCTFSRLFITHVFRVGLVILLCKFYVDGPP
jgi:hypothetical protein